MIPLDENSRHKIAVRLFEPPRVDASTPGKILLLKIDHIGDFVSALEGFRLLRKSFERFEITLICAPSCVSYARATGLFDEVRGFSLTAESNQIGKGFQMGHDDSVELFKSLLNGPYLIAADFRHEPTARALLDLVPAFYRAGFAAPTQHGLDIVLPALEWDVPSMTVSAKNLPIHAGLRLSLLAHAIVDTFLPDLPRPEGVFEKPPLPEEVLSDPRMKIGVSMGAGAELRMWSAEYWATFLARVSKAHEPVIVFFGSPDDGPATDAVLARLGTTRVLNLVGKTSLADVAHYMQSLSAYVGCDTGLTHMAAELGIPTVNIFAGISNVSVWRARGPKVRTVFAEVACAPCHLRFRSECPNGNVCMTAIVPDIVWACFEQVLAC